MSVGVEMRPAMEEKGKEEEPKNEA